MHFNICIRLLYGSVHGVLPREVEIHDFGNLNTSQKTEIWVEPKIHNWTFHSLTLCNITFDTHFTLKENILYLAGNEPTSPRMLGKP